MKYSLRSLLMVVTLVCVALGGVAGRIDYLRQAAAFHERERNRYFEESLKFSPTIPEEQRGFVFSIYVKLSEEEEEESSRLFSLARYHHVLFERYKQAVWRPWTIVDESQPPP